MACYLICIDSFSGIPIFARKLGSIDHLEFPIASSLHNVRVFGLKSSTTTSCSSPNSSSSSSTTPALPPPVELLSTSTSSTEFTWRDYPTANLTLIYGVSNNNLQADNSTPHTHALLDLVYSLLCLHLGKLNLIQQQQPQPQPQQQHQHSRPTAKSSSSSSLDKLRYTLKSNPYIYASIDLILNGYIKPTNGLHKLYTSDFTNCLDVTLGCVIGKARAKSLQGALETVLEGLGGGGGVEYGAMYWNCTVVGASKGWRLDLHVEDRTMIGLLAHAMAIYGGAPGEVGKKKTTGGRRAGEEEEKEPKWNVMETMIYLTKTNPNMPLRLIVIKLTPSLHITLLCGQTPTLAEIQESLSSNSTTSNAIESLLLDPTKCSPGIGPVSRSMIDGVHKYAMGFLAINNADRLASFVLFGGPEEESGEESKYKVFEGLKSFYRNTVPTIFPSAALADDGPAPPETCLAALGTTTPGTRAKETIWTSSSLFKCHGLCSGPYQLYISYDSAISMVMMRKASWALFRIVFRDGAMKT